METTATNVRQRGGSLGVSLTPQLRALGLAVNAPVLVSIESGRIVIARAVPEPQQPAAQPAQDGGQA